MEENNTIEVQNQIIQRQKKMITELQDKLDSFKVNIELEKYFPEPEYNNLESLIKELENQKIIFDDAIKKAKGAESKYKELIASTEPLVKEYKKKLKKMNTTFDKYTIRK